MRSSALAVTAALGVALAPGASAGGHDPTPHRPLTYVAMGDSYAAGVGLEPLAKNSPAQCRQAAGDFAHLLAARERMNLTDVACGGATTRDFFRAQYPGVTPPQLKAINARTDVVTMTIGGNDSDVFSDALTKCSGLGAMAGGKGSPCKNAFGDSFTSTITQKTFPKLVATFLAVRLKAPHARVAVIAYPKLMPPSGTCFPQMPVADGDAAYVSDIQSTLNRAIQRAAKLTGVTYVDASSASVGHDACKPVGVRWVEPVYGYVTKQPAHPNTLGEQAMADLTRAALRLP